MQYQSTKNSSLRLPFDEVLLGNLAPDGGLYVPEKTPHFSLKQINDFQTLTYQELTKTLLYPVKVGDTLSRIGSRFGIKASDIQKWNELKSPQLIYPGQVLKIILNNGVGN